MPVINCETGQMRDETPEELAAIEAARQAAALQVPTTVSPRQMKLAMLGAGLLDNVEAFVAGADRAVQISWEYATEFNRFDPMLLQMAAAFGLTEAQVDDLFRAAATL